MSGELGPETRGIVDAGRDGDDPTPGDRARVRASVMQSIAVGGGAAVGLGAIGKASASVAPKAAAGAAAAAKTATTFGVAKLIGVVAVVAAVGGGGYTLSRVANRPTSSSAAQVNERQQIEERTGPVISAPVGAAPQAPVNDAPEPAPVVDHESAETPHPAMERPPAARGVTAATPSSATESDPLTVETRQIREAELAVRSGDAARALAILDAPAPGSDGQMSEERSVARVGALCHLGRVGEAKAIASRFVAEHPSSPLVDRMQHPCADGDH